MVHRRFRSQGVNLVKILAVAGLYFVAGRLGLQFAIPPGLATPIWLPSGVAVASVLHWGNRIWPGIWLGSFAVNIPTLYDASTPASWFLSLGVVATVATGSTCQALLTRILIGRLSQAQRPFDRVRDVLGFLASGAAGCLVGSTIATACLALAGFAAWSDFGVHWLIWWLGDLVGVLLVSPLPLFWGFGWPTARWHLARPALFLACLAIAGQVFLGAVPSAASGPRPVAYLFVPFLVWAAIWFGQRGVMLTAVLIATMTVAATVQGRGPFATDRLHLSLLQLQAFVGVLVTTGLVLAAAFTERRRAQQALEESEARKTAMLESGPDAIISIDAMGRVVEWNPAAERIFGYSLAVALGRDLADLVLPPATRAQQRAAFARDLATGEQRLVGKRIEIKAIRADGSEFPVEVSVSRIPLPGPPTFTAIFRDITERKRIEERLRLLVESAPHAMITADPAGRIVSVNNQAERLFQYRREELIGQRIEILVPQRFRPQHVGDRRGFMRDPQARPMGAGRDLFGRRKDGSEVPVEIGLNPVQTEDGLVVLASITDITQRKEAERSLRESEARLKLAQQAGRVGVFDWDMIGGTSILTEELELIFGVTPGSLNGGHESWMRPIHPDDLPRMRHEIDQRIMAGQREFEGDFRILRTDGRVRWLTARGTINYDDSGRPLRMIATAMDVTGRKESEEALAQTAQRLQLLSEIASRLLASPRPQETIAILCQRVMQHLGCDLFFNFLRVEGPAGWHLNACAGPADLAARLESLDHDTELCGNVALNRQPLYLEDLDSVHQPAKSFFRGLGLRAYACLPLSNQGQLIGTLAFGSRQKGQFTADERALMAAVADQVAIALERVLLLESIEQRAAEAERAKAAAEAANQSKSVFLANMSHELRTPMAAITGMTDLALEEESSPVVREYLETVKGAAETLLAILNDILDFSRVEAGALTLEACRFHLADLVRETIRVLSVRADEKALRLTSEIAPDVPDELTGDSLRLRQILVNLLGNAIKFTDQGEVALRVRLDGPASTVVRLVFEVADTGIGIAPEQRSHIFAPFTQADPSTTRRFGGTGLGLAISSSLVKLMRGTIDVESELGKGSRFWFTIPFARPAESAAKPCSGGAPRQGPLRPLQRPLRILLAEDTPANQKLIVRILTKRGHSVEVAPNGQQAVELVRRQTFDLVIMDVQMPVMDGFQATAAIRALNGKGHLPIIAMTAYAMKGDQERCLAAGMNGYLSKPVNSRDLIETVERWALAAPLVYAPADLASTGQEVHG